VKHGTIKAGKFRNAVVLGNKFGWPRFSAMAGTSETAVAPLPMTTTFLPV